MNIQPLFDHVVLQASEVEENTTASGIVVASTAPQSAYREATVVAVGPGQVASDGTLIPVRVKAGDIVLVEYLGQEFTHNDEKYYALRERDIFAIVG